MNNATLGNNTALGNNSSTKTTTLTKDIIFLLLLPQQRL